MSFKSETLETNLILAELAGIKCDVGELRILLKSYAREILREGRQRELIMNAEKERPNET